MIFMCIFIMYWTLHTVHVNNCSVTVFAYGTLCFYAHACVPYVKFPIIALLNFNTIIYIYNIVLTNTCSYAEYSSYY